MAETPAQGSVEQRANPRAVSAKPKAMAHLIQTLATEASKRGLKRMGTGLDRPRRTTRRWFDGVAHCAVLARPAFCARTSSPTLTERGHVPCTS
jgi:hypothetical protein